MSAAGADDTTAADLFARERPRLVGLAYRLLGSLSDAEDVVQDAWFRWERADRTVIARPEAWLTTVVSRLGLDTLRARQRDRAEYVGPWLPEPLVAKEGDPADAAGLSDTLTTAFLMVLEALSPVERLVLLLADVFEEPFPSIASITGKSEANCRQIAVRARRKLQLRRSGSTPPLGEQRRLAATFAFAALADDRETMLSLLSPDVVLVSDGGKDRHAARRPVRSADRVARFVANIAKRIDAVRSTVEPVLINGSVGLLVRINGRPYMTQAFEFDGDRVTRITAVLNPAKLALIERDIELV